jgi:hypothetical protein
VALNNLYTGAHGTLGVAVAGTPAERADFDAIKNAYTDLAIVGRVTEVDVCVHTEIEEFFEIGVRDVANLSPGNVRVSGAIGRAYINGAALSLLLGRGASSDLTTIQPTFVLNLTLKDPSIPENSLIVSVFGVRFESWSLNIPQDHLVMEKLRFKAFGITVKDSEANKEIKIDFPQPT